MYIVYILYVHIWWIAIILTQWFQHVVTSHFHSFLKELEQTIGHEINGSLVDILDLIGVHAHQSLYRNPCSMRSKQALSDKTCKFSQPCLLLFIILTSAAGNSDPACQPCLPCLQTRNTSEYCVNCHQQKNCLQPRCDGVAFSHLALIHLSQIQTQRLWLNLKQLQDLQESFFILTRLSPPLWWLLVYNLHSQVRCIISIIRHP